MPDAEVVVVPGSHGGFNWIDALNDRIAVFIQAHSAGGQTAAQPARLPGKDARIRAASGGLRC
jgi:hypothetical protein